MPAISEAIEYPSSETSEEDPEESIQTLEYGELARKSLYQYAANKKTVDTTFGIYSKDGQFYIGTLPIKIHGDDITVGGKTYTGTPGLWELIVMDEPDKSIYNSDDLENYEDIMVKTNAMCQPSNSNKPKSSRGEKYKEIIKPIWDRTKGKAGIASGTKGKAGKTPENKGKASIAFGRTLKADIASGTKGKGVTSIILPSDPDELVKLLSLRMAACDAGNTGAGNEAVAICDELLRQGVFDKRKYQILITPLSRLL